MFYNTTNEIKQHLKNARDNALKQDRRILELFKAYGVSVHLSPWDVQEKLGGNIPITSIRRGINTLTKDGMLEKTNLKKKGIYGKHSYCWKLAGETMRLDIPL